MQNEISNFQPKLILYPTKQAGSLDVTDSIELVARAYNLDIRSIDQLVPKFLSCLRTAKKAESDQIINVITLLVALVEFDSNCPQYKQRKSRCQNASEHVRSNVANDFSLENQGHTAQVSELFNLLLESSSFTYKTTKDNWGEDYYAMLPMSVKEVYAYTGRGESENYALTPVGRSLINLLQQHVYKAKDSSPKYWLWDDYKKVVELAGNID
ncbi:hypothetical protein JCM19239_2680 [Vibrio variabilis]|uniref:Uncharacterized protein n=1 Tax=Vibrio variabilis TaxID=990271 RepID=A0ABQ0JNK8_9VIBR|nr:hypothetical protein JCM19239_2680 [Vibrio variabilis]